jgi:serine/threonine protein kinase/TolA-binding protein
MSCVRVSVRFIKRLVVKLGPPSDDSSLMNETENPNPDDATLEASQTSMRTTEPPAAEVPLSEGSQTVIGRFRLLEKIGEGGFGVVYIAEQKTPVKRRVALKIIKLGMDTRSVVARFEAERQALAMMDHPNIAKVFDAGATDTGRPYFVMELVRGIPITDYCDQNNLPPIQRLGLFIDVCHAIQHAHQKGVIHRDIKPSNILVTLHDGVPVPKVIDFGIAKATQGDLTDKTIYTQLQQFIGTPAYMSPEQAEMSGLDVDTRSDIYSLGVLLYELLTGTTPFDAKELMNAGMDEMRRRIRETEPMRPSNRLSGMTGADSTGTAKRRGMDASKLVGLLRGDLDWVVMKCLEKDRTRRYETANGLAMDIQRHLNNEPITARPPSSVYRFRKALRRNKLAFGAAAVVMLALLLGIAVSTWQAVRATRARAATLVEKQRADEQASVARSIAASLQQMLGSANPDTAKGHDYTVRQLLDEYENSLSDKLADQPEAEAELQETIGNAYWRLGEGDKGVKHLERALELRGRVFGAQHEQYADTLVDYAWALMQLDRNKEAEARSREALGIYRNRGIGGQRVIRALQTLQVILDGGGRTDEIEPLVNEALAEAAKTPGVEYPEIAGIYHGLIQAKLNHSEFAEAERLARLSLAMHLRLEGPDHPETGWGYRNLGNVLNTAGHGFAEALQADEQALAIFRKDFPPDHVNIGYALVGITNTVADAADASRLSELFPTVEKLGELELMFHPFIMAKPSHPDNVDDPAVAAAAGLVQFPNFYLKLSNELTASGRIQEAKESRGRGAALAEGLEAEIAGNDDLMPEVYGGLVSALMAFGEQQRADDVNAKLVALTIHPKNPRQLFNVEANMGDLFNGRQKYGNAEVAYREALVLLPSAGDVSPDTKGRLENNLGAVFVLQHKFPEAEQILRQGVQTEQGSDFELRRANTMSWLGASVAGQRRYDEAEPILLDAYKQLNAGPDPEWTTKKRNALNRIIDFYELSDKPQKANEWRAKTPSTVPTTAP